MDTDEAKSNVQDLAIRGDRVHIGSRITQGSSFPGMVDDCRVYDRVLTADEIAAMGAEPPTIVWVSFHGADDAPSGDAADAGFTEAADIGYTDLLKGAGYNVLRYVTGKNPDAAILNAADLVMTSRSVNSGDYSKDAATRWNGISAPMIITGGYPLRSSRMGYTTGKTMVDTTGDVTLTVSDPDHPIFAGIALTDGTMDNPFAGVVVYPTDGITVARGVSINTDEVNAEGTVLAVISEASADTGPVGGMVIGEWPAGAVLTHEGGAEMDELAGPRLVFITGSREASGIDSETAGLYDLYDDGTQMLLNAVDYMLNPPSPLIQSVVRANGVSGDRDLIGEYGPNTAPLPMPDGGLMDGNPVFSDRTYPWAGIPAEYIGAEYIPTFNSDKNGGTVDVTYTVTISRPAIVWITCDDRIPDEWDSEGTIASQQDAVDRACVTTEDGTFVDTGIDIFVREADDGSNDRPMSVFAAELDAGTYVFNSMDSGKNFYTIGAVPLQ